MNTALRESAPAGHSHRQRLEAAGKLAALILERHGDTVVAIVALGTTAIGQDGPYSDLDMTVVTRRDIGGHSKCYPCDGLQINLDYQTVEESFEEAREPHMGGCWANCLPLHDPTGLAARLREAFEGVSAGECDRAFAAAMGDGPATYIGKVRNAVVSQDRAALLSALQGFGECVCRALCIINGNHAVTGTARLRDETKTLALLPAGFSEQIDQVTGAVCVTEQGMYEAAEDLWAGMAGIARRKGLRWEQPSLQA